MKFKHSGGRGDIVYALPAIKRLGGGTLYIDVSRSELSSPISSTDVSLFSELLCGEDYIERVESWTSQRYDVDLDDFRLHLTRRRHLAESHALVIGRSVDLSVPWLDAGRFTSHGVAEIIVSRTPRFHGFVDWRTLSPFQDKVAFVGTRKEYTRFQLETGLAIRYEVTSSYVDLVKVILGSSLFVGNQSFPFSLAEAFKHPRVLEIFPDVPNCMPHGANAHLKLSASLIDTILA